MSPLASWSRSSPPSASSASSQSSTWRPRWPPRTVSMPQRSPFRAILVNTYDWAFQWGPGLVAGIGNGLLLGYLMYRSALVPPRMALLGLIGGSLLILEFVLILSGVFENGSTASGLLTLPEAAWELSLGI